MPRTYIKIEYFQFIQARGSVTIDEFAKKFSLPRASAAVWLSKWAGRGYLKQEYTQERTGSPGRPRGGGYTLGDKWWGDLVHGSELDMI